MNLKNLIITIIGTIAAIITILGFVTGKAYLNEYISSSNSDYIYAIVNTPGPDGFLALRSEPSNRKGKRIVKIPHLKEIKIHNCKKDPEYDRDRIRGYWCECEYKNLKGWIFDAYIKRK